MNYSYKVTSSKKYLYLKEKPPQYSVGFVVITLLFLSQLVHAKKSIPKDLL